MVCENLDAGAPIEDNGESAEMDVVGIDGEDGVVLIGCRIDDGRRLVLPD